VWFTTPTCAVAISDSVLSCSLFNPAQAERLSAVSTANNHFISMFPFSLLPEIHVQQSNFGSIVSTFEGVFQNGLHRRILSKIIAPERLV